MRYYRDIQSQGQKANKGSLLVGVAVGVIALLAGATMNEARAQYTDMAGGATVMKPSVRSSYSKNPTRRGIDNQRKSDQIDMQINEVLIKETPEEKKEREAKLHAELKEKSYQAAQDGFMPMTEDEIRRLLSHLRTTQEAIQTPIAVPPTPEVHVEEVSLDPASPPPVIQLAVGNVTTLTFLDMTGEPWPVVDMAHGGEFEVKPPEPGGHVVRIIPLKEFGTGNVSIRLLDFKTPVTFELRSGGDIVHYRYDARIPEIGPNGRVPIMTQKVGISAGDKTIISVLEGVLPENAKELEVSGVDGRTTAYEVGKTVLVRTPLTMLSPAWTASVSSADGMNVYSIPNTPVILLSKQGEMVKVKLSHKGESNVE